MILTQKVKLARIFVVVLLGMVSEAGPWTVSHAQADILLNAQTALNAGAPNLALDILLPNQLLVNQTTDTLRMQWQTLAQAQALSKTGASQQIIDAAAQLPADAPDDVQHAATVLSVQAALSLGNGPLARANLAKLFWQWPVNAADLPAMRALVVESHLLPQPDAQIVSLLLRFQQDFGVNPILQRDVVLAILKTGQKTDLSFIRTGLLDTDLVAILIDAQANALFDHTIKARVTALLQNDTLNLETLQVLHTLVSKMNNNEANMLIDEHLLNAYILPKDIGAELLWSTYRDMAQNYGNLKLLLFGSDSGWAAQAQTLQAANPEISRAIWAYLARQAQDPTLKTQAQLQFLEEMRHAHMGMAALRLFDAAWPDPTGHGFPPEVRAVLGQLALEAGDDKHAVQLWQDLSTVPANQDPMSWQLMRTELFARDGEPVLAAQALAAWLALPQAMNSAQSWQMVLVAKQLSRNPEQTVQMLQLLTQMYSVGDGLQQQVIAACLGRMLAMTHPKQAAMWYLLAAGGTQASDENAWLNRRAAAACLSRAGLHDDAKNIDQHIVAQCQDAMIQAEAQEALAHD